MKSIQTFVLSLAAFGLVSSAVPVLAQNAALNASTVASGAVRVTDQKMILTSVTPKRICGRPLNGNSKNNSEARDVCFPSAPELADTMGAATDVVASSFTSCAKEEGKAWKCWGSPTELIRRQVNQIVSATSPQSRPFAAGDNLCTTELGGIITCTSYDRYENGGFKLPARSENSVVAGDSKIQHFGPYSDIKSVSGSRSFLCVIDGADVKCQYAGKFKPPLPAKFDNPRLIAATGFSVCVIDNAGLKCFGSPIDKFNPRPEWKDAVSLSSSVLGICAIRASGAVECEVDRSRGSALSKIPANLEPSQSIGIGFGHMCSLSKTGHVTCWDNGVYPELSEVPTFAEKVTTLAVGESHTCALLESGLVKCWGKGDDNQLQVPVSNKSVLKIAAGKYYSCVYEKARVTCNGSSSAIISAPVFNQVVALSVPNSGGGTVCGIDATVDTANVTLNQTTKIKCWGYDPSMNAAPADLVNPTKISVSTNFVCATNSDSVQCWGNDTSVTKSYPDKLSNPKKIATGLRHACVIDDFGLACWGTLESETATTKLDLRVPSEFEGRGIATDIAAGDEHTCVLTRSRTVNCWGDNSKGQLNVPNLVNPVSIGAVESMTCASDDNGVTCWGTEFGTSPLNNDPSSSDAQMTLPFGDNSYMRSRYPFHIAP